MTIRNAFLIAVLVAATPIVFWANKHIWKRVRDSGHRNWAINPRAYLAGLQGFEILILAVAVVIASYAVRALAPHANLEGASVGYLLLAAGFVAPIILAFFAPLLVRVFIFALYAYVAYSIVAAGVGQKVPAGPLAFGIVLSAVPLAILGAAI